MVVVGQALDGGPIGWNLVVGVNAGASASERSVWTDRERARVGRCASPQI